MTVQNHLNFLHGVFAFSMKRGWVQGNPVALVDRPRKSHSPHRRLRFLQPHELDALIRSVPGDLLGAVEAPLYLAAALTGLRQGELLALKWMDIDWLTSRIRVADNYTRGVVDSPQVPRGPIGAHGGPPGAHPRAALPGLEAPRRRGPGLRPSHTGHHLDPSKVRKRFRLALEAARVRAITFRELRHTFGTQMAAAGAPLRAIQEWMGHADADTTEIYRHYRPRYARSARRSTRRPTDAARRIVPRERRGRTIR